MTATPPLPDKPTYLSKMIDKAAEDHATDELLAQLVQQVVGLRYHGGDVTRLEALVTQEIEKKIRALIARWLDDRDEEMYELVAARLTEAHVKPIAQEITDQFIEDWSKGRK